MTTTTLKNKGARRAAGGARSISREARQAGGTRPRQRGGATTDRQAVMIGHTVRILVDYDGLQGSYGQVIDADHGDGQVLVRVGHFKEGREICFLSREVVTVPMNDTLRDTGERMTEDAEVYQLIERCVRLRIEAGAHSDALVAAMRRRAQRLQDEIRALQRACEVRRVHRWLKAGINPCTALVVWEGGAK